MIYTEALESVLIFSTAATKNVCQLIMGFEASKDFSTDS